MVHPEVQFYIHLIQVSAAMEWLKKKDSSFPKMKKVFVSPLCVIHSNTKWVMPNIDICLQCSWVKWIIQYEPIQFRFMFNEHIRTQKKWNIQHWAKVWVGLGLINFFMAWALDDIRLYSTSIELIQFSR